MAPPQSCDTFVVLPPLTNHGVVFGKNSDRPQDEVQEVVYFPSAEPEGPIQCTYIEVESSGPTKAVILSKPGWMWGAEMGANECGVAIGNEAVWTKDNEGDHDPSVKRLLGMDLVRLGLERSSTAEEALTVITNLLETYGQGGPCSNTDEGLCYHNSFLIADPTTAWILETSGKHWAAEEITSGHRNISNVLTIMTKIDKHSEGLQDYAKEKGFWDGEGDFNFAAIFGSDGKLGSSRLKSGEELLATLSKTKDFKETDMFTILRNKDTDICRSCDSAFPTQGSQVSVLSSSRPSVHWFTATPDPSKSVFKPFVFTPNAVISKHTKCPEDEKRKYNDLLQNEDDVEEDIQVLKKNKIEDKLGAPHTLYSLHKAATSKEGNQVQDLLLNMEADCVRELDGLIESIDEDLSELDELLKDCVETEVKFYR